MNTFQGILVTDYVNSYAIFIYQCGDLNYSNDATIGFVTRDGFFGNHETTLRNDAQSIACQNSPTSPWVNIVYRIGFEGLFFFGGCITLAIQVSASEYYCCRS